MAECNFEFSESSISELPLEFAIKVDREGSDYFSDSSSLGGHRRQDLCNSNQRLHSINVESGEEIRLQSILRPGNLFGSTEDLFGILTGSLTTRIAHHQLQVCSTLAASNHHGYRSVPSKSRALALKVGCRPYFSCRNKTLKNQGKFLQNKMDPDQDKCTDSLAP